MANINSEIEKIKRRLIAKAKAKGLYENFGQTEVRKLKDKYPTGYMGEERINMDAIDNFESWARSVDDRVLK